MVFPKRMSFTLSLFICTTFFYYYHAFTNLVCLSVRLKFCNKNLSLPIVQQLGILYTCMCLAAIQKSHFKLRKKEKKNLLSKDRYQSYIVLIKHVKVVSVFRCLKRTNCNKFLFSSPGRRLSVNKSHLVSVLGTR